MKYFFAYILILLSFNSIISAENLITGIPIVVDGDTIKIKGISIRLHGIDTPERNQKCKDINNSFYFCGKVATKTLIKLIDRLSNFVFCISAKAVSYTHLTLPTNREV